MVAGTLITADNHITTKLTDVYSVILVVGVLITRSKLEAGRFNL